MALKRTVLHTTLGNNGRNAKKYESCYLKQRQRVCVYKSRR